MDAKKKEEKDNSTLINNNLDEWPIVLWAIFSFFVFISGWHYLQIFVALSSIAFAFIFIKERWRRKKEGYYVHFHVTSPEGGSITYVEDGKTVELYLYFYDNKGYNPIVCVPSNDKWNEVMPDWAKSRKEEIINRIKKRSGYSKYEETGKSYQISPQCP